MRSIDYKYKVNFNKIYYKRFLKNYSKKLNVKYKSQFHCFW